MPTRLAEDAAAEAELIEIGYRDRLFTELVANAADAAAAAGETGRVAIWARDTAVHVANTGAPLTADGVRSLTALRVSPKTPGGVGRTVGRFGLGFRATAFAPRVVIASTTGSVQFDADRSRAAIAEVLPRTPEAVPVQRLAWPSPERPTPGFVTEVIVQVDDADRAAGLVAAAAAQAPDLLLELEAVDRVEVDGVTFSRRDGADETIVERDGVPLQTWLTARSGGTRWLVRLVDGRVVPEAGGVLRSPTATDVELTLPARVVTDLPLTPDRRELHPDADIAAAAAGYPELVALVPDDQKSTVLPPPALGAGRVDAALRSAVRDALAEARWVPSASGEALRPSRAWVLPGLSDAAATLLRDVLEPLAAPAVCDRVTASALVGLGARELGLADVADLLTGVQGREPRWWAELYAALAELAPDARDVQELSAIPVPRADGRMHVGCRGLFLIDGLDAVADAPAPAWVPTVAPAAYDPLLERLGVERISPAAALEHPALEAVVDDPDADPEFLEEVTDVVLRLLALPDAGPAPTALGALDLPCDDGDTRSADELLLPGSPLVDVLVADAPFGVVSQRVVDAYGADAVRRLGVGWGFGVLRDPAPVAPDHDLADEESWWDEQEPPPETLAAVRDLDLVDPNRWPAALDLLAGDPDTAPLLADGYTRWWLRRYARIDDVPLRLLRDPDDHRYGGLFDAVTVPEAARGLLAAQAPEDADEAGAWLAALGDPDRDVAPGAALRAHAALLASLREGRYRLEDVDPPDGARTLAGTVTDDPLVVDAPWWIDVIPAGRCVLAGLPVDAAAARMLADLLDVDTVSDRLTAIPDPGGDAVGPDSPEAVALLAARGLPPAADVRVHDDLVVTVVTGENAGEKDAGENDAGEKRVPMWVDDAGVVHLSRR